MCNPHSDFSACSKQHMNSEGAEPSISLLRHGRPFPRDGGIRFERCYVTNLHCAVFRINQEIMRQSAAKNQSKIFDFQTSSTGLSKLKLSKIVSDSLHAPLHHITTGIPVHPSFFNCPSIKCRKRERYYISLALLTPGRFKLKMKVHLN